MNHITNKARILTLIREAEEQFAGCGKEFTDIEGYVAEYLTANGVIAPPCKVGDAVYKITRNKVKECEVVFVGLSADEKCSYFDFVENYEDGTFYRSYSMGFDVIGRTVFFSREEAEAALKGDKNE